MEREREREKERERALVNNEGQSPDSFVLHPLHHTHTHTYTHTDITKMVTKF